MELVVFVIAIVFFMWLKSRLSVDNPGGAQQCMEFGARRQAAGEDGFGRWQA